MLGLWKWLVKASVLCSCVCALESGWPLSEDDYSCSHDQMSFLLLSNHPATGSELGHFLILLGGLQFYVTFLSFVLYGLILLARLLENLLLLFPEVEDNVDVFV